MNFAACTVWIARYTSGYDVFLKKKFYDWFKKIRVNKKYVFKFVDHRSFKKENLKEHNFTSLSLSLILSPQNLE